MLLLMTTRLLVNYILGLDFLLRAGDYTSVIVTIVLTLPILAFFKNVALIVWIGMRGRRYLLIYPLGSLTVTFSVRVLSVFVILTRVDLKPVKPLVFTSDLSLESLYLLPRSLVFSKNVSWHELNCSSSLISFIYYSDIFLYANLISWTLYCCLSSITSSIIFSRASNCTRFDSSNSRALSNNSQMSLS
jgi:hypothetical protein